MLKKRIVCHRYHGYSCVLSTRAWEHASLTTFNVSSSGGIPLRLEGANKTNANQRWLWRAQLAFDLQPFTSELCVEVRLVLYIELGDPACSDFGSGAETEAAAHRGYVFRMTPRVFTSPSSSEVCRAQIWRAHRWDSFCLRCSGQIFTAFADSALDFPQAGNVQ